MRKKIIFVHFRLQCFVFHHMLQTIFIISIPPQLTIVLHVKHYFHIIPYTIAYYDDGIRSSITQCSEESLSFFRLSSPNYTSFWSFTFYLSVICISFSTFILCLQSTIISYFILFNTHSVFHSPYRTHWHYKVALLRNVT